MSVPKPKNATSDADIMKCFPVMSELRPRLQEGEFLQTIREMQKHDFALAYVEEDNEVVAVAGYRISRNLFLGKHLYVDDLVTAEHKRSLGHGETLYRWLRQVALNAGCEWIHLDSGTQRRDAHRFYFREGMAISSFHFVDRLDRNS